MAASSFTSVSIEPPLVSVCVQNSSRTWLVLRQALHIGLSVLSADQEDVCRSLSARTGDRFAQFAWSRSSNGAIFVDGAAALLDCTLYGEVPAGDHGIALLQIHEARGAPDFAPLVFHGSRFCRLAEI
jgi:flavin reductase (DIM6/NTAB) family NADH-FMN oxidoreductase RutF